MTGLTKTIAKEWGQFKINCNAIAFGFVETRLTAAKENAGEIEREGEKIELGIPEQMRQMGKMMIPLGRAAEPAEAAGPVLLLCSDYANYIHGQVINVTGGQFTGMYRNATADRRTRAPAGAAYRLPVRHLRGRRTAQ